MLLALSTDRPPDQVQTPEQMVVGRFRDVVIPRKTFGMHSVVYLEKGEVLRAE